MPRKSEGLVKAGQTDFIQRLIPSDQSERQVELIRASLDELTAIWESPAKSNDTTYIHTVLCQIGLPRAELKTVEYKRDYRNAHLLITAGKVWQGQRRGWVQQCLPFGTYARLIMNILSAKAVKTGSPVVEIGRSATEFLSSEDYLDKSAGGSQHKIMVRQMLALAACTIQLAGDYGDGRGSINIQGKPFTAFQPWSEGSEEQPMLWPGFMTFSDEHFRGLVNGAAVPLDQRHVLWLSKNGGSLAIDIYWWLAQRLRSVREPGGLPIGWAALKEQFGQDYKNVRDFRKEFKRAFAQVLQVYRDAKVEPMAHGIRLFQSRPPITQKLLNS